MTDKEMLEWAAKAAGLKVTAIHGRVVRVELPQKDNGNGWISGGNVSWEPLDNDTDALRLAVNLNIFNTRASGYQWPPI